MEKGIPFWVPTITARLEGMVDVGGSWMCISEGYG